MPALPLWGIVVLAIVTALIIIALLVCLFRCRRFPGSTVDPAEYSAKKQGFHSIVTTEATSTNNSTQEEKIVMRPITPTPTTTTTASSSSSQPCTPTTTTTSSCSILPSSAHAYPDEPLSEKNHEFDRPIKSIAPVNQSHHEENQHSNNPQIHITLPSTSLFTDKIELDSNETNCILDFYPTSTSKQPSSNQRGFISIDFSDSDNQGDIKNVAAINGTINHVHHKPTATIKSTFRQSISRQKSPININQLFDDPISDRIKEDNNDSLSPSSPTLQHPSSSSSSQPPPPPAPDKPTCTEENTAYIQSSNLEDKPNIILSAPPFHQPIYQEESALAPPPPPPLEPTNDQVTIGMESIRTVKSHQILDYNIDSMFAWPSTEAEEEEEEEEDKRQSIASVLQNRNGDTMSITSGSVHRLVRDSTVIDTDYRSLAARSIANSVRPSLHDMASWWPKENQSIEQGNTREADQDRSPSPMIPSSNQSVASISIKSTSKASIYTSSPKSTFSRATLNKFRMALANEESDEEPDIGQMVEEEVPLPPPSTTTTGTPIIAPPALSSHVESPASSAPTSPVSPISPTDREEKEEDPSIKSRPTSVISTVSRHHQRLPSPEQPSSPIRSSPRNSTIGPSSNIGSVRRVLQSTWNANRLSDQGSIASARTALSQGMSPPGSVNPRQLNQHLASMSIQSHSRLHNRPGLPTGFMNDDLLVPNASINGPTPTVSFSSSTVRTMIPENDPIESHVGKKKTPVQQPKQSKPSKQPQQKSSPKQKQQKDPMTTKANTVTGPVKDKQSFGTMRTGRQQRSSMPWNTDAPTKSNTNKKTPAQKERDRYLQSLKS